MATKESNKETKEIKTISKVYADVLSEKPELFFEHETCEAQMSESGNYSVFSKIGEGTFGIVYEGFHKSTLNNVILKVLKSKKKTTINREIKMLEHLKHGDNIVKLNCVVESFVLEYPIALIFDKLPNYKNFRRIFCKLNEYEIRFYTYELLRALDYCHSQGVMHRDLKPCNIIVNRHNKRLVLIDFSLADFYRPGQKYSVNVSSLLYKGPELLVGYEYYDYSVDLWSLGCIFASMIFRRFPFFCGKKQESLLINIIKVLGSQQFRDYLKKYSINLPSDSPLLTTEYEQMSWASLIISANQKFVNDDALDLLNGFLKFDHIDRITAKEGMKHKYFDPVTKTGNSLEEN